MERVPERPFVGLENTLDADRVTTFCPELELDWVYRNEDGSWRKNCIALGEAVWRSL